MVKLGNNLGTIRPKYQAKPATKSEQKARRANKIAKIDEFRKPLLYPLSYRPSTTYRDFFLACTIFVPAICQFATF